MSVAPVRFRSVSIEPNLEEGFIGMYFRLVEGPVFTSCEVSDGVVVDVDAEGRPLGIEVIATFPEGAQLAAGAGKVSFAEIRAAVEKRFGVSVDFDSLDLVKHALA